MEIFWNTIAQYNENTWWAQIIITVAGIPADRTAIPQTHRPGKMLHENIYGIPQRLDSIGVLSDVL